MHRLLRSGADVESPNAEGQTALMSVARTGNVEAAKLLIRYGADVDAAERFGGLTPLLYAVCANCKACVEVLLRHDADINLPDPDGVAPLTVALMNRNWDIAKRLVERGADPNQPLFFRPPREPGMVSGGQRGTTPFHRACFSNDVELVKYLLAHGADVHLYTAAQQTPMMLAVQGRGREDDIIATLRGLKEAGADPNVVHRIIYMVREHGGTALHFATRKGSKCLISELVALGADLDIKDEDGLTPLDYAMSRGWLPYLTTRSPPNQDLAGHLRSLGATVELDAVPDWPGEFPPIRPPRHHESEIWPL